MGEIHCGGRLAHATFLGGDGNNFCHGVLPFQGVYPAEMPVSMLVPKFVLKDVRTTFSTKFYIILNIIFKTNILVIL